MKSIRRQLTRELLGATFTLLGIGLLALYFAARDAAYDQFDDALRAKALAISTLTIRTPSGLELDFSDRFFRGFDDRKPRDFFELWDENNRPVARSESVRRADDLPRRTGRLERPARWNLKLPNDRAGRAIGFVFKPNASGLRDQPNREVQLVVASDREELDETLWQLLGISVACGVLLLGGTLWVIPRVLRRGLQPITALGEQVMLVDADSLATRTSARTYIETRLMRVTSASPAVGLPLPGTPSSIPTGKYRIHSRCNSRAAIERSASRRKANAFPVTSPTSAHATL